MTAGIPYTSWVLPRMFWTRWLPSSRSDIQGLALLAAETGTSATGNLKFVAQGIRSSRPHMLFLGITSPKKEVFLARYGPMMNVLVCHGVGGSFDVMAGKVRRAPRIWQRIGLEWLYRVVQEPRRCGNDISLPTRFSSGWYSKSFVNPIVVAASRTLKDPLLQKTSSLAISKTPFSIANLEFFSVLLVPFPASQFRARCKNQNPELLDYFAPVARDSQWKQH